MALLGGSEHLLQLNPEVAGEDSKSSSRSSPPVSQPETPATRPEGAAAWAPVYRGAPWSEVKISMLASSIDAEIAALPPTRRPWSNFDALIFSTVAWGFASLLSESVGRAPRASLWFYLAAFLPLAIVFVGGALHELLTRTRRRQHGIRLQRVVRVASSVLDTARSSLDPELRLLLELAVERGLEALQRAGVR